MSEYEIDWKATAKKFSDELYYFKDRVAKMAAKLRECRHVIENGKHSGDVFVDRPTGAWIERDIFLAEIDALLNTENDHMAPEQDTVATGAQVIDLGDALKRSLERTPKPDPDTCAACGHFPCEC